MKILYFAWLAERLGKTEEHIAAPKDASALLLQLCAQYPDQAEVFANPKALRIAVNQQLTHWQHPLSEGDEVAIFPPMTGG